ncbi:MAG: PQQ-binding-like beta-propeller repeat protein [Planctomycetaceae bacterium]
MKTGCRISPRMVWQLSLFAALVWGPGLLNAGDWPQILGPNRDGRADDERLAEKFPADGPRQVWELRVGEGFAGVAIAGDRGILFHRVRNQEEVLCFEPQTGARVWATESPASYQGGIAPDNGPRCVPLVQGDRVIVFGAAGQMHCLALADGARLWTRDLYRDFKGSEGYFGAGSTPLVVDGKVLVNVGGGSGAGVVALKLETGETVWKSTDEGASYSSPVATQLGDGSAAIFVTRLNCLAIRPSDGSVLWRFPFGARGPTVNAASPIRLDDRLFLSASYGIGAVMAKISPDKATPIWETNDSLSSQYTTSVLHDGMLYGVHGRADGGDASLRCVDPQTGKVLWSRDGFGVAHAILADDKLLLIKDDGTLVLVRPDPARCVELGEARVLKETVRALPALSRGRLYLRDTRRLISLDVSAP